MLRTNGRKYKRAANALYEPSYGNKTNMLA